MVRRYLAKAFSSFKIVKAFEKKKKKNVFHFFFQLSRWQNRSTLGKRKKIIPTSKIYLKLCPLSSLECWKSLKLQTLSIYFFLLLLPFFKFHPVNQSQSTQLSLGQSRKKFRKYSQPPEAILFSTTIFLFIMPCHSKYKSRPTKCSCVHFCAETPLIE